MIIVGSVNKSLNFILTEKSKPTNQGHLGFSASRPMSVVILRQLGQHQNLETGNGCIKHTNCRGEHHLKHITETSLTYIHMCVCLN